MVRARCARMYSTAGIRRDVRNWLGQSRGRLPGKLFEAAVARQIVESGGGLRIEHDINRAAWDIPAAPWLQLHARFAQIIQRRIVERLGLSRQASNSLARYPTFIARTAGAHPSAAGALTTVRSLPSGPAIERSTSAQSATERQMGPILSMVQISAMAPCRLTRPNVGRTPATPQRVLGETMEPRVSVPMENPTSPAAVAEADPADEPLDDWS